MSAALAAGREGTGASAGTATGPLARIAIVGASVSAGLGGTPFGDAFTAAAPRSAVQSSANVLLFQDPMAETARQLETATQFKPTILFAVDLLFWDVYGGSDPDWHRKALGYSLDRLETLRAAGVWIVVGDVPLITNASEMMLPKDAIPSQASLDEANRRIAEFAKKDHVVLVPLADWTSPLRTGAKVKLPTGETVDADELMAIDGLHANPLGTWYLLDKLDHFLEAKIPGVDADALSFKRPSPL